jgi:hypothetical protein
MPLLLLLLLIGCTGAKDDDTGAADASLAASYTLAAL